MPGHNKIWPNYIKRVKKREKKGSITLTTRAHNRQARTNISQFHARFRRAYKFDSPKKHTFVPAFREIPQSAGI